MADRAEYMRKWHAEYRKKLSESGGRRLIVDLTPAANRALAAEMQRTGRTAKAVICSLLEAMSNAQGE